MRRLYARRPARSVLLAVAAAVLFTTGRGAAGVTPLVGDCDGDGVVTISDLVTAVAVALGAQPLSRCPLADADGDGAVTIAELVQAVNAALSGGVTPTPAPPSSPTATPPPLPTPTPTLPPGPRVYDFGAVGGEPCTETFIYFDTPEELPFTISATITDFCLDAAAFDVAAIECDSPFLDLTVEQQPDCRLFDPIDPRGQVRFTATARQGVFEPGSDFIGCSIPVRIRTAPGDYLVRYYVRATTSQGPVAGYGETIIDVIGLPDTGRDNSDCCERDDQCESGFCRGGDASNEKACCHSDCGAGICNSDDHPGSCCMPENLPDLCRFFPE